MTIDQIVSGLKILQGVLATISQYTNTTIDDRVAAVLQVLLSNQALIDLIKRLLDGYGDAEQPQPLPEWAADEVTEIMGRSAAPDAVPVVTIIQMIPVVIALLKLLWGK